MTSYLRFGVLMLVSFALTPVIIRNLGSEEYGLWSLAFAVLGLFGLLDLGFGTGVVKWVAESSAAGDHERRNRLLSTVAAFYVVLALAAAGGIWVLGQSYDALFDIPAAQSDKAWALLWILALRSVLLSLPLSLFRGILFGEQRIYAINLIQLTAALFYGGAAWAALERGYGLLAVAWLNLAGMLVEHVAYLVVAIWRTRNLRISPSLIDLSLVREVIAFSSATGIVNIGTFVLFRMGPMIVKAHQPLQVVAVYAVGLKLVEAANMLVKQYINVLAPLAAAFGRMNDGGRIRFLLLNCTKYALATTMLLVIPALACGRELLVLWVGPEFTGAAAILAILMATMVISVPQMLASNVLAMTGHHRFMAIATVAAAAINVAVSLVLVRPLGLVGVALGTVSAALVIDVFVIIRKACAEYGLGYGQYLAGAVLPAAWPAALQFLLLWALGTRWPVETWSALGLQWGLSSLLYAVLLWSFGLQPVERTVVKGLLGWSGRRQSAVAVTSEGVRG
ncbi:MAG: polysaccharide biosynthesis C-terminal domain-containing protein [Candidatus Latescibacterota bacterium]